MMLTCGHILAIFIPSTVGGGKSLVYNILSIIIGASSERAVRQNRVLL